MERLASIAGGSAFQNLKAPADGEGFLYGSDMYPVIEGTMTTSINSVSALPRNIRQVKQLQEASRRLMVVPRDPERGRYLVASAHDSDRYYHVAVHRDELSGHCTCPWAHYGGINCKHVLAALRAEYEPWGAISFWPTSDAARRQHRHVLRGEQLYATLRPRAIRNGTYR